MINNLHDTCSYMQATFSQRKIRDLLNKVSNSRDVNMKSALIHFHSQIFNKIHHLIWISITYQILASMLHTTTGQRNINIHINVLHTQEIFIIDKENQHSFKDDINQEDSLMYQTKQGFNWGRNKMPVYFLVAVLGVFVVCTCIQAYILLKCNCLNTRACTVPNRCNPNNACPY